MEDASEEQQIYSYVSLVHACRLGRQPTFMDEHITLQQSRNMLSSGTSNPTQPPCPTYPTTRLSLAYVAPLSHALFAIFRLPVLTVRVSDCSLPHVDNHFGKEVCDGVEIQTMVANSNHEHRAMEHGRIDADGKDNKLLCAKWGSYHVREFASAVACGSALQQICLSAEVTQPSPSSTSAIASYPPRINTRPRHALPSRPSMSPRVFDQPTEVPQSPAPWPRGPLTGAWPISVFFSPFTSAAELASECEDVNQTSDLRPLGSEGGTDSWEKEGQDMVNKLVGR